MSGFSELDKFLRRQRLADPESLEAMAAVHIEKFQLRLGADTLGYDAQAQSAGERNDRLGDGGVARIGLEVGDEGNVDLQGIDREMLEVRQARITRAEIVDGDG